MVRNGETLPSRRRRIRAAERCLRGSTTIRARKILFEPLVAAVSAAPTSAARIRRARSSRRSTGRRRRRSSARRRTATTGRSPGRDDDRLYTAYGDGWGFEPLRAREAAASASPASKAVRTALRGVNIRSATVEQKGDGTDGKKASGMLMVDGVLYLWARNAGNSQLAWSTDHGQTWTWADWKFTHELRLSDLPELRQELRRGARRLRLHLLARRGQRLPGRRPHGAGPRAEGQS